jgi:hypothetical protein
MKRNSSIGKLALASSALCLLTTASYADVTYLVSGTFTDGATLSGDYVINTYGDLSGWDLTTTTSSISGYNYTPSTTFLSGCGSDCLSFNRTSPAYLGGLQLTFTVPLGSYGPVGVDYSASWENYSYTAGGEPIRYFTNLTVTGVPEASTWTMMLLGLAGLGFAGYRASRSSQRACDLESAALLS